jgi:microsomal epoxide hydrolase
MNAFPNFTISLVDGNDKFDIHFVSLFSKKADAIPILLLHGWPGSFLEFLPMLSLISSQYTPETLPYHFIVPSLPGYAFSSKPPLDRDFRIQDIARLMNSLMTQLGFEKYVVQGGDIGSKVARVLVAEHPSCVAAHRMSRSRCVCSLTLMLTIAVNFGIMPQPLGIDENSYTELEKQGIKRGEEFKDTGSAYALLHATRPSTIAFSLSASPLSLLPWLAEKFLTWSDPTTTPP